MAHADLREMARLLARDPDALTCLAGGAEVAEFERAYALLAGHQYALACASGTAALQIALLTCDIRPGDEVVVAAYGWPQTVSAVLATGATPVFADVTKRSGTLSAAAARRVISSRTRALLVTHLFGNPADMDALRCLAERYGLFVIADACHALGASYNGLPVGSLANISAYSLGRGKLVSAGEGGVATTSRRELYERMLSISQHALRACAELATPAALGGPGSWGLTSRMTRLSAAIALEQLAGAQTKLEARQQLKQCLREWLRSERGARLLGAEAGGISAAHELVVLASTGAGRARLLERLTTLGAVASAGPVRTPLHLRPVQPASWWPRLLDPRQAVGFGEVGRCPVAESICGREVCVSAIPEVIVADSKAGRSDRWSDAPEEPRTGTRRATTLSEDSNDRIGAIVRPWTQVEPC